MGVDVSVYSLIGLKVRSEDFEYVRERYEELYEDENFTVELVDDCMCGEYAYVGVVLSNVDAYEPEEAVVVPLYDKMFSAEHVAGLIRASFPELIFEATEVAFHSFPYFH